jgi:predicted negative regulator of RcsB-dependent stress response
MPPKKISRKQLLKEPDEFITLSGKLIQFFSQYKTQVIGSLSAIFIVLAAIAGYRYYLHRAEAQSSAQLTQLQSRYEALLADGDAVSAYQAIKPDMDRLIQKYGNRTSGKLATIVMGDLSYQAGEYEAAQRHYELAQGSFPEGSVYANRLLSSLAYTYLAKGGLDQARTLFERAASGSQALLGDEALFNLAIMPKTGERAQDSALFWQKIVSDHDDSLYGEIARERAGQPGA